MKNFHGNSRRAFKEESKNFKVNLNQKGKPEISTIPNDIVCLYCAFIASKYHHRIMVMSLIKSTH
jgi:hypothetical protein